MAIFKMENYEIRISAAFARQRFMCSSEYSGGVCHGACCSGPTVVLLSEREAKVLAAVDPSLPISGRVMVVNGSKCPLSLQNGHCKYHGTVLQPFICRVLPFELNRCGKLILDNRYMRRRCRVRGDVEGGLPAYRCFRGALDAVFGQEKAAFIVKHFDEGGGDLTVPVSFEVLSMLDWHRKVIESIKKFGYSETVRRLSGRLV